jgi:hypothetical protein
MRLFARATTDSRSTPEKMYWSQSLPLPQLSWGMWSGSPSVVKRYASATFAAAFFM